MFEIESIDIQGCFILTPKDLHDLRGNFIKLFHKSFYTKHDLTTDFREQYYSISKPHVFRGLHFQYPPEDHVKLVTCIDGEVLDLIVDLRKKSPTYNQVHTEILNDKNNKILYLPNGIAHGFYVSSDKDAIMLYNVTTEFSQAHDGGIHYNGVETYLPIDKNEIIVSMKDNCLPQLQSFISPF